MTQAFINIAMYTQNDKLSEDILSIVANCLKDTQPDVRIVRNIAGIAKQKPSLFSEYINILFSKLDDNHINNEVFESLYILLMSGDKDIKESIKAFIDKSLSKKQIEPIVYSQLLYFAQNLSYKLDRSHYWDTSNSKLKKDLNKIPDNLLYLILAQGVEGYITTFKEVHREFKQRRFHKHYLLNERTDDENLWEKFNDIDPNRIFLGSILYAYSAKGHLSYIIPNNKKFRHHMIDTSLKVIDEINDKDEVKSKGTLMAETITFFLYNQSTGGYSRNKLIDIYHQNKDSVPKRVMFESLIFKNKEILRSKLTQKEIKEIILSGHYADYTLIPNDINRKNQRIFIYFSPTQKGYLTRMIDYYTGNKFIFLGDKKVPHPHLKTINGFVIDKALSTSGIADGSSANKIMAKQEYIKVVLVKQLEDGKQIMVDLSNRLSDLEMAVDNTNYVAYCFAGHSSENWLFRDIIGRKSGEWDRFLWIYDGSCGGARHIADVITNPKIFLFSNLETGKGPVNQIQVYYIAHYLAKGLFKEWEQLKSYMISNHTGYTDKLLFPGSSADNVLKNYITNINRLNALENGTMLNN